MDGTTTTGLGGGAYSFYLNVVVLNQALTASSPSGHGEEEQGGGGSATAKDDAPPKEEKRPEPNLAPAAAREDAAEEDDAAAAAATEAEGGAAADEGAGGGDKQGAAAAGGASGSGGRKGLLEGVTMPAMPASMSSMGAQLKSLSFGSKDAGGGSAKDGAKDGGGGGIGSSWKGGALDKSLHNTMKAVSKRSVALSDKASRYVAGKTMIARASAALDKALPEVVRAMSSSGAGGGTTLDLTVGRRFQQGPVIVLQVDLKASGLPAYVEAVRGEDAAEHYRCALSSLRLLGAESTVRELEREMLPVIRKGLMERMGEELVRTMKAKDESGAPLEVECIALEEAEEARWLFTYMEFQSQMK